MSVYLRRGEESLERFNRLFRGFALGEKGFVELENRLDLVDMNEITNAKEL